MALIRPRLTDAYGVAVAQAQVDFAIPLIDEDIPLFIDPFLLWKSPSMQDRALHNAIVTGFNQTCTSLAVGDGKVTLNDLVLASECDEVGLGSSATKRGKRISTAQANSIVSAVHRLSGSTNRGLSHLEELQLLVDGIGKDRISDFAASFLKSFLIDFTTDQSHKIGIPVSVCDVDSVFDMSIGRFTRGVKAELPLHPITKQPILLIPKRWLRFSPWINFEEYFRDHCPADDATNPGQKLDRVSVLSYNRDHYGMVEAYIQVKERQAEDCKNDPLFSQIPVLSAKRHFASIRKLPTGKTDNADKTYEHACGQLMASLMYPQLDFACEQSRTDSGVLIRDLIFHNTRSDPLLVDLYDTYGSRQIVFELKNVRAIEREHVNQLNRYLTSELGGFGIFVTRSELAKPIVRNLVDLWSGQRRCILALTDADLEQMSEVYESKQRNPIDVIKKKYVEFRRLCPG